MADAERWWVLGVGIVGLLAFAGGSLLARVPAIDATIEDTLSSLAARRRAVLTGLVTSLAGVALLLWPLCAVATWPDPDRWPSLALFSVAAWALGFGMLAVGDLLVIAVVWRRPDEISPRTARALLDAAHLAVWSVSAPIGAIAVVATTVVGWQADLLGPIVVAAAAAKVVTVAIEVAGTGRRTGWNAGGWAAGSSGYVTVVWFALVLEAFL